MLLAVVDALKNDKIVCFPTETIYALACSAYSENSVRKLYSIKRRPLSRPFSLLLSDLSQVREFSNIADVDMEIVRLLSPGPITFVFPLHSTQSLPRCFFKDTLGIRIPDHVLARDILRRFGSPVVATSANISGEKSSAKASDVPAEVRRHVSEFLENDCSVGGVCSTVFDVVSRKVLRMGMMSETRIIEAINVAEKQHGYSIRTLHSEEYLSTK